MKIPFPSLLAVAAMAATLVRADAQDVAPPPAAVVEQLSLSPFYQKHLDVRGFSVVSSSKVPDAALREAGWLIERMLAGRQDILRALAANRVRFAIMAHDEFTTDLPEHSDLEKPFYDRRARGLGPTPARPAVSCGAENLLCYEGDPYSTENILIHEFSHAIHLMGLNSVDPSFDRRLAETYDKAMREGLWKGTYAATNKEEYWAEMVQSWFDNNRANDALHNHVDTRSKLKEYDPDGAALVKEVFGDGGWRYRKPSERAAEDREHLRGWDSSTAPVFVWPEHLKQLKLDR